MIKYSLCFSMNGITSKLDVFRANFCNTVAMISHAVNNITIWDHSHDELDLFSSEFKYASCYSCMVGILDGGVIVVSLISFRYFAPGVFCCILLFIFSDALQQKVL